MKPEIHLPWNVECDLGSGSDTTVWDFSSEASKVKMQLQGRIHPSEASVRNVQGAEVSEAEVLAVPSSTRDVIMAAEPRSGRTGVTRRAALCFNVEVITGWVVATKCYSLNLPKVPRAFLIKPVSIILQRIQSLAQVSNFKVVAWEFFEIFLFHITDLQMIKNLNCK